MTNSYIYLKWEINGLSHENEGSQARVATCYTLGGPTANASLRSPIWSLRELNQGKKRILLPVARASIIKGLRENKLVPHAGHLIFRSYLTSFRSKNCRLLPSRKLGSLLLSREPVSLRSARLIARYYCGFFRSTRSNLTNLLRSSSSAPERDEREN